MASESGSRTRKPAQGESAEPLPKADPLGAAVRVIFDAEDSVRTAVTARMQPRAETAEATAERARTAFARFTPSRYSAEQRSAPEYLAAGDDVKAAQTTVFVDGADVHRESDRELKVEVTGAIEAMMTPVESPGSLYGRIEVDDLVAYIQGQSATAGLSTQPVVLACRAESEAERRIQEIEAPPAAAATTNGAAVSVDVTVGGVVGPPPIVGDGVTRQMATATSPEATLSYGVPAHADQEDVQRHVDTFELRAGASDVTSYHDFNTLQIAFPSVWTEIFDHQLVGLGQELYEEYVKLKTFAGVDTGPDRPIDTLDDLRWLMDEMRALSSRTQDALPWEPESAGTTGNRGRTSAGSATSDVAKLFGFGILGESEAAKAIEGVLNPLGLAVDTFAKILEGKQMIRWDDFARPLPPGGNVHQIDVSFQPNTAPAGYIKVVLLGSPRPWKGINLQEYTNSGTMVNSYKLSTDPLDRDVWAADKYNNLLMPPAQAARCLIEFDTETAFGIHHGFYLLGDLATRLPDRMQVTFNWVR